jgi:hypothetical protein
MFVGGTVKQNQQINKRKSESCTISCECSNALRSLTGYSFEVQNPKSLIRHPVKDKVKINLFKYVMRFHGRLGYVLHSL